MTETTHEAGDRSPGYPLPVTYDPASGAAPAGEAGTVVVLLVAAAEPRWAAEAAVGLAAAWSRGGGRVVLADLHLEDPVLHTATGTANVQGVVDVLLYGASIGSTARPVPGHSFYLIPAGTYEPDVASIYTHPRWAKMVTGFRDANATLVLFAPAAGPELSDLADAVDRVILLGEPDQAPALAELEARGLSPDTVLIPPRRAAQEPTGQAVPEPDSETLHAREMMIPPEPPRRTRPAGTHLVTIVTILLAATVFAIGGFLLARARPDLIPWAGAADPGGSEAPVVQQVRAVRDGPSPMGAPLPYSVSGWAFMTFDAAQAHALEERGRFTAAPFFVSPEEIQGVLYFKVLAGAVADTAAASALRARLVESGTVEPTESIIQFAPLAFDLGEFTREDAAAARRDSLAAEDVPSYVVRVPYSDETQRWQLYAGAYRDSVSAEAMRQILTEAEVESRLVARIGEPGSPSR